MHRFNTTLRWRVLLANLVSTRKREEIIKLTDKALAEGVFGAPTMVVDGEIYWGKDRFEFIEDHLKSG